MFLLRVQAKENELNCFPSRRSLCSRLLRRGRRAMVELHIRRRHRRCETCKVLVEGDCRHLVRRAGVGRA